MAHEDQGGGALLDLSHEIDYMSWLFGHCASPIGVVHQVSALDITSDDLADFTAIFGLNMLGSIHMDLLDRSYNRRLRIVGSEGTLSWNINDGYVVNWRKGWQKKNYYNRDRNVQFTNEMVAFIDSVKCGTAESSFATLDDGVEVLKTVLELKKQNGR
jgi:predicted dehydrogenase